MTQSNQFFLNATGKRTMMLVGIILMQVLSALFFIGDVIADIRDGEYLDNVHLGLEAFASVALIAGVLFLMLELRRLLTRMGDMDAGLKIARGQMVEVMNRFFDEWNLTQAERDVALMILKGLDNESIAQVRNTAAGTVRAQATSIYSKSDTQGRSQFVSLFVEELMSGDFSSDATDECP
ncbi:MAG: LuxR family transcriptional regulator [Parvibaculum sp.]|nr:LuxR family transcriptional regulator [Parvibaculum sp.]